MAVDFRETQSCLNADREKLREREHEKFSSFLSRWETKPQGFQHFPESTIQEGEGRGEKRDQRVTQLVCTVPVPDLNVSQSITIWEKRYWTSILGDSMKQSVCFSENKVLFALFKF